MPKKGELSTDARRYNINVRLHKSELKAMHKYAQQQGMGLSAMIRRLFYQAFPPLKW